MKFKLKGDVTFDAEHITDALKTLGKYFKDLSNDKDPESIFISGKIEMSKIKE